jgi:hypothetical protein
MIILKGQSKAVFKYIALLAQYKGEVTLKQLAEVK